MTATALRPVHAAPRPSRRAVLPRHAGGAGGRVPRADVAKALAPSVRVRPTLAGDVATLFRVEAALAPVLAPQVRRPVGHAAGETGPVRLGETDGTGAPRVAALRPRGRVGRRPDAVVAGETVPPRVGVPRLAVRPSARAVG